ncbi:MAG: hypothetical protein RIM23_00315, partial [Coleofasciculus sp. G3-WIS-01]
MSYVGAGFVVPLSVGRAGFVVPLSVGRAGFVVHLSVGRAGIDKKTEAVIFEILHELADSGKTVL